MDLIVSFIIFIGAMLFCLTGGHTMVIALGIGLICFAVTGIRRGFSAGDILGMCRSGLRDAVIVVIVMFIIGFVTGIWRSAGTISFFVYYGIEVITPKLFLVITFLLCCILSYALGTSFGVAGTVGVIFMALARSGGVNEAVTAGVIMSGIYFGDRNSPVSSSAVLVAGVTHTSLYDNVRLMLKTGAPAIALTFIAYCFLSFRNPIIAVDESFKELLTDEFSISPWCALPAALILILPVLKVSVINSLIASIVAGTAVSILVQGESVGNVCLTLLRGYEIDGPLAEIMNGGGLIWSIESGRSVSKNACSNGPGALCALRLYEFTQDEKYLDDAKMIYEWLSSTLYTPETGAVADNMANGVISGGALSYNQGTFLGSAHMLYTFTGDRRYLIEAMRAAEYQMTSMSTDGIMNSEASNANSDNSLFKGIFIRYATLLALDENIDADFRKELSDFMTHNAIVCWTEGIDKSTYPQIFFNYDWTTPYTDYYKYYQPQVSASTLIEAMTRLH